jgi:F-type H+-transporting ATPase subunit epsilon
MADTKSTAPAGSMRCIVVTPEATLVDDTADFVALPLFDGEIGIAPSHSPLIGRLGFGELRIESGDNERKLYVDGGFVEVVKDVISVLTNRAVEAKDLDLGAAEAQLEAALKLPANTDELLAIRDRTILQARAQIQVARRSR